MGGKALLSFYDGSIQGSNYGVHVCDCHYEDDGCIQEENRHNTCNCDANLPEQFTDTGTITNTSALPVARLFFGGLSYDMQEGAFKLGRSNVMVKKNYDKEGNTQIHLGSQVTTTTVATTIESTVATTEPSEAKGFITLYTSVR